MRTTLMIDDDVLEAAKAKAAAEHRSLGEVISALARHGLAEKGRLRTRNGIPLLPDRENAPPVTLEIVNRLRDESD